MAPSTSSPTIPGFTLTEPLGAGDHVTIWSARDLGAGRDACVQVVNADLTRMPGLAARLSAVVAQLVGLHHPRIVTALTVVRGDGLLALVTEPVVGVPLSDLLDDNGCLPAAAAIAVADDVLRAIGAAHGAGVVHCGPTPSRILVDADGQCHLDGFAMARALALTGGEVGMPRPGYGSPERLGGALPDGLGDLYAAAALVHEVLTGSPPATGAASQISQLPGLSQVIGRAVAADPARRFPSAAALRGAVVGTAQEMLGPGWRDASDLGTRARLRLASLSAGVDAPPSGSTAETAPAVEAGTAATPGLGGAGYRGAPPPPSARPTTVGRVAEPIRSAAEPPAPRSAGVAPRTVPWTPPSARRERRGRGLLIGFLVVVILVIAAGGSYAAVQLLGGSTSTGSTGDGKPGGSTTTGAVTVGGDIQVALQRTTGADCQQDFVLTATGSVGGSGTLAYHWEQTDGAPPSDTRTVPVSPGTTTFRFTYDLRYTGKRTGPVTVTFVITQPDRRTASQSFDTSCG